MGFDQELWRLAVDKFGNDPDKVENDYGVRLCDDDVCIQTL